MSGGQGLVWISTDLELDLNHQDHGLEARLDVIRQELIERFAAADIPATWAVTDPLYSAATESLLKAGRTQEIAVLGDEAWLGPGCGQARLARELARRFTAARQAGIPVATLAVRHASQMPQPALLWEYGVKALCPPASSCRLRQPAIPACPAPKSVWQSPVPWRFPLARGWWSLSAWSVGRAIRQVARGGTALHLRLELRQVLAAPRNVLRWLAQVLDRLGSYRREGRLAIRTLGEQAAVLGSERTPGASHSILRPAA